MIGGFLPSHGAGEVLLTTRLQALGTVAQRIGVEKMGLDEGVMFLLRRTKSITPDVPLDQAMEESRAQATDIVASLDGLPLALDQAGAYIEETSCGLPQYLHLYATRRKELLLRRGRFPIDHPDSVAATWSLSFQQVEQESPAAVDLLHLLAFLDPEAIPEEIITLGAAELGLTLGTAASDLLQLDTIIALLLRYSLIRRTPEKKLLSIHHLVQIVLRDGMDGDTQRIWAERTIRAVNCAFPEVESQTWQTQIWQSQILDKCQLCLPHVQRCMTSSEEYGFAFPEAARLFNDAASYLVARARYEQAELLLLRALVIRQQILKAHHPDTARSLNDLGGLYLNKGRYKKAKPLLQEALTIRLQVLGEEHLDVAQSLYDLASTYRSLGNYKEAEPCFLQALHIREKTLEIAPALVAQSYYGLAKLYLSQNKYQQAENFCKKCLAIRKSHLGNHSTTASTLNIMAKVYQGQCRLDEAEELNKCALQMRQEISGANHPQVATIINSLIEIYHAEGKYQEAEPLIARSLQIYEEALDPKHPYMAYSLRNKAENFFLQGIYDQAEEFYKKALTIREEKLGLDHPHTASICQDLAKFYFRVERYEEAESFSKRAFLIREKVFEINHPIVINTLKQRATVLRKLKRESEANEIETHIQANVK
jgi:tetratricopeptide (TPR) repeat protein